MSPDWSWTVFTKRHVLSHDPEPNEMLCTYLAMNVKYSDSNMYHPVAVASGQVCYLPIFYETFKIFHSSLTSFDSLN